VPIFILSVASIIASHEELDSKEIWVKIHKHLGFHLEGHPALGWIRHVLNLGYNDLSLDLKTCLLYFSIFLEGSEIMKNDLVKRWLAEGFVTEKHGYGPHEIAESYFSELINRNMIQIAKFDDCGHVLSCRVHDMMLEFIILKSIEEHFVSIMNDVLSTKGCLEIRRLSLQVKNSECNHLLEKLSLTQARSFTFQGPAQCMPSVSMFQLLRLLHINGESAMRGKFDLSCICHLFKLKYLRIIGISCMGWPKQLRKLQHLQTLEISEGYRRSRLDVGELPLELWHLTLPYSATLVGDIGRIKSLISVDHLSVDDMEGMERMMGLGNLTDLRELVLHVNDSIWITDERPRRPYDDTRGILHVHHLYVPYLD
jgi:disease resistance protein RPM1